MNQIWVTDANTMVLFFEMVGKIEKDFKRILNRSERGLVFMELMKSKNIKPSGNTELNKKEFLNELALNGKKILNIDEKGYNIIKKKIKGEK